MAIIKISVPTASREVIDQALIRYNHCDGIAVELFMSDDPSTRVGIVRGHFRAWRDLSGYEIAYTFSAANANFTVSRAQIVGFGTSFNEPTFYAVLK